jgi:hypothetical protein
VLQAERLCSSVLWVPQAYHGWRSEQAKPCRWLKSAKNFAGAHYRLAAALSRMTPSGRAKQQATLAGLPSASGREWKGDFGLRAAGVLLHFCPFWENGRRYFRRRGFTYRNKRPESLPAVLNTTNLFRRASSSSLSLSFPPTLVASIDIGKASFVGGWVLQLGLCRHCRTGGSSLLKHAV